MKLELNKTLKALDGSEIPTSQIDQSPFTYGKAMANILIAPKAVNNFDKFKSYELAKKLYNEETLELDKADFKNLKDAVERDGNYTSLILGQLLEYLNGLKDE